MGKDEAVLRLPIRAAGLRGRLSGVIMALLIGLMVWPLLALGQPVHYNESQLKVLFMQNFAKYTTWPQETLPETNGVFTLGLVGAKPSDDAVDLIRGKMIKNREWNIKRFADVAEAAARRDELAACQVVFVGAAESDRLREILQLLGNTSVLTIGEAEGFLEKGGIINFLVLNRKLGFEINQAAARRANLKLDSQLLKLAKTVKE